MPLVPAKCPSCGGTIEIDNAKETGVCIYCRGTFLVEKAINYYTQNYNIQAQTVNIIQNNTAESAAELFKNGEAAIEANDFNLAHRIMVELIEKHPGDFRGYWGYMLEVVRSFESRQDSRTAHYDAYEVLQKTQHYNNALKFAPESAKKGIMDFYASLKEYAQKEEQVLKEENGIKLAELKENTKKAKRALKKSRLMRFCLLVIILIAIVYFLAFSGFSMAVKCLIVLPIGSMALVTVLFITMASNRKDAYEECIRKEEIFQKDNVL